MDWNDEGFVLTARRHGENALIVSLLTRDHGRHAGLVRGGSGTRGRGLYQPGNLVQAQWRARLSDHLGTYTCEMLRAYTAGFLDQPLPLLALSAATSLVDKSVPEREPVPQLYEAFEDLIGKLDTPDWALHYVRWELGLLSELGFGLDLTECAATGATEGLTYVSPKSGRAVSTAAAAPYRDRLLALPAFLQDETSQQVGIPDIVDGLALTGYFLKNHVVADQNHKLPSARERLVESLSRAAMGQAS
jgi:DNA repair protein RecO (recombination protein O)